MTKFQRENKNRIGKQKDKSPEGRFGRINWRKKRLALREEQLNDPFESFCISFYLRKKNRKI